MNIHELFDKHEDEYLHWERVENKKTNRPDLHALLLLDELFPIDGDIIIGAEHGIFYVAVDDEQSEILTEEQVIELLRCGCHWDSETDIFLAFSA